MSEERWFEVRGQVTVSARTFVKAADEAQAVKLAKHREVCLAPYGTERSGVNPTEVFVVEDADGSAERMEVDEMDQAEAEEYVEPDEEEEE